MGYEFQVTVDAENPHTLAKWWAQALDWEVEPSDEGFIRGLVQAGHVQESDTMKFEGVLVWREGTAIRDPEHSERPRVLFQLVPESKTVKNRLHLDLRVGDGRDRVAERLEQSGATLLHRGRQGPNEWITMADPEGNEFCVC
ncbi:VOC family protein [Rhodococcus marinonascens]|uniref:VOC family protein n=1 Tax=Rhodococcus marinonascens TaxID=38311 RepID=UPI000933C2C3|nr:VOC family protein [Rhodococcus marinonascens]